MSMYLDLDYYDAIDIVLKIALMAAVRGCNVARLR